MSLPDSEDTEEDEDEEDKECCWRLDRAAGEPALCGDKQSLCWSALEVCSPGSPSTFWT